MEKPEQHKELVFRWKVELNRFFQFIPFRERGRRTEQPPSCVFLCGLDLET